MNDVQKLHSAGHISRLVLLMIVFLQKDLGTGISLILDYFINDFGGWGDWKIFKKIRRLCTVVWW